MKALLAALLFVCCAFAVVAEVLTRESLAGTWTFSHILLEGGEKIPVDQTVEFQSDGTVVTYKRDGEVEAQATFRVENGSIVYSDAKGRQTWQVKLFDGKNLQVDHSGAELFFVRQ